MKHTPLKKRHKAAVIGYPVMHSLSPVMHRYWLRQQGLAQLFEYEKIEVHPEHLIHFLEELPASEMLGVNVTVPHKEAVFRYIDTHGTLSEDAKAIGAVNTVIVQDSGYLYGTNTDSYGFIHHLIHSVPSLDLSQKRVLILGAGGAARAIIYGLIQKGVSQIVIANRSEESAKHLQTYFMARHEVSIQVIDWQERSNLKLLAACDLLINTTSLGMVGKPELEIDVAALPSHAILCDIVYNPLHTNLLTHAKDRGLQTVDGLGMLIYQGARAFSLFFNETPNVDIGVRDLLIQTLKTSS